MITEVGNTELAQSYQHHPRCSRLRAAASAAGVLSSTMLKAASAGSLIWAGEYCRGHHVRVAEARPRPKCHPLVAWSHDRVVHPAARACPTITRAGDV
ncbi:hypothetical protein Acsp05_08760 [Actinokineospora sp. NBRC 105648]|nr:hypothetical protein Acsp05_08760 [Actinokineospora sp. NBRC 105648]